MVKKLVLLIAVLGATEPAKAHATVIQFDGAGADLVDQFRRMLDRDGLAAVSPGGREIVSEKTLAALTETQKKVVYATGRLKSSHTIYGKVGLHATVFYLGKYNGEHWMAGNAHSFELIGAHCDKISIEMDFSKKRGAFKLKNLIGSWKDIDFALFTLRVPEEQEPLLSESGIGPLLDRAVVRGRPLFTVGFPQDFGFKKTFARGPECAVTSEDNEFKLQQNSDSSYPYPYSAWSFVTGCPGSSGVSGSAVVDRDTGAFVGILWDGAYGSTYVVPVAKIREVLGQAIRSGKITANSVEAVFGVGQY